MKFVDSMIKDGLWDAFNGYHMGTTAENVAKQWQIGRDQQDEFAVASQNKAEAAQKAGKFADEIVPMATTMGMQNKETGEITHHEVTVDRDECNRPGTTMEGLSGLQPVREGGYVTAGNASQLSDGAAAVELVHGVLGVV